MDQNRRFLIFIDGVFNLLIGSILLLFPLGMGTYLGLPISESSFYPILLGAVIFGIGIALMLEWKGSREKYRGLGLEGAITINFLGGGALLLLLLLAQLQIPMRGMIILWIVAIAVLIIGVVEFSSRIFHPSKKPQ
jgi:hypothetical protein